jgi:hypothetical protein
MMVNKGLVKIKAIASPTLRQIFNVSSQLGVNFTPTDEI